MEKIKISAVSYINTYPFIYGLEHSGLLRNKYVLKLENPAQCAASLLEKKADLALVPVAVLPELSKYYLVSDYCIGAQGKVLSVVLMSNSEIAGIKKIYLDYQSRTSVQLVKVLAEKYWKINVEWVKADIGYEKGKYNDHEGIIMIGDRVFENQVNFKYVYDLAEEWQHFSQLPFVFACWVSHERIPEEFIEKFNQSIVFGLNHVEEALKSYLTTNYDLNLLSYLKNNISYHLDEEKKRGMYYFLDLLNPHH